VVPKGPNFSAHVLAVENDHPMLIGSRT
jgi:hypothetical protein